MSISTVNDNANTLASRIGAEFQTVRSELAAVSASTPDAATIVTNSDSTLTAQDIAIGGDLSDLASARGQIGDAVLYSGDLNDLTAAGVYLATSGTLANNHPSTTDGYRRITVTAYGTYITQVITTGAELWRRQSTDSGSTWTEWIPLGGSQTSTLNIYISASGDDSNTGLSSSYPVATINRALRIARALTPSNSDTSVTFRVGEGDWGSVTLRSLPFFLNITDYSASTGVTEYSESIPHFTAITVSLAHIAVSNIHVDTLLADRMGIITINHNYLRVGALSTEAGGLIYLISGSTYPIDIVNTSQSAVFSISYQSAIISNGAKAFNIVEDLAPTTAFLYMWQGGRLGVLTGWTLNVADDVTVTGTKYSIKSGSKVETSASVTFMNNCPGDTDGTIEAGCLINGLPYGGGSGTTFLRDDLTWVSISDTSSASTASVASVASEASTASVASASLTSSTASYLPLSGGTLTGAVSQTPLSVTREDGGTAFGIDAGTYNAVFVDLALDTLTQAESMAISLTGAAEGAYTGVRVFFAGSAGDDAAYTFADIAVTVEGCTFLNSTSAAGNALLELFTYDGSTWYGLWLN